jgi:L-threonine kinase
LNQRLCPKRTLDEMIAICAEVGGLGVVTTHSGTALGVLLDEHDPAFPHRVMRTRRACRALSGTVWTDRCLPGLATDGRHEFPHYLPADRQVQSA